MPQKEEVSIPHRIFLNILQEVDSIAFDLFPSLIGSF